MPDTIFVRGEGGSIFKLGLPLHEAMEDKLRKGQLVRVDQNGEPFTGKPDGVAALPETCPGVNAAKTDWIGWAVAKGCAPDDAEAFTKADLIEMFGA